VVAVSLKKKILVTGHGLLALVAARLVVIVLGVVGAFLTLRGRRLFVFSWHPRYRAMAALFKQAAPMGVLIVCITIFVSVDVVMLFVMRGEAEVGIYTAATKFLLVVLLLPKGFIDAVLPAMSRRSALPGDDLQSLVWRSNLLLLVLVLPIVALFSQHSDTWVGLVYNDAYAGSAWVLAILSWSLAFDFMNSAGNRALLAQRMERGLVLIVLGAAVFNVVSNAAVIPRYGAVGAAGTTVATEGLVFLAQTLVLVRTGITLGRPSALAKPLVAFAVMVGLLRGFGEVEVQWWMGVPIATAAYLLTLWFLGTFTREDVVALARIARSFLPRRPAADDHDML